MTASKLAGVLPRTPSYARQREVAPTRWCRIRCLGGAGEGSPARDRRSGTKPRKGGVPRAPLWTEGGGGAGPDLDAEWLTTPSHSPQAPLAPAVSERRSHRATAWLHVRKRRRKMSSKRNFALTQCVFCPMPGGCMSSPEQRALGTGYETRRPLSEGQTSPEFMML